MVLPLLVSLACSRPEPVRVAMVGIDGGDWSILDEMIAAGHTPNLARFREEGATAPLIVDSAESPESWTSIASGVHPNRHGVQQQPGRAGSTFFANPDTVRVHRVWDMATRNDRSTFMIDYWVTSPAYDIKGVMISREGQSATPPGAGDPQGPDVEPRRHAQDIRRLGVGLNRSERMQYWLAQGDFDLVILPFYGHDQALHRLMAEYTLARRTPDAELTEALERGAQIVEETAALADQMLGWAIDYVGEDGYVVLFSDHGHTLSRRPVRRLALGRAVLNGKPGTVERGTVHLRGGQLELTEIKLRDPDSAPDTVEFRYPRIVIHGDADGAIRARLLAETLDSGAPLFMEHGQALIPSVEARRTCLEALGQHEEEALSCFVNSGSHGLDELGIFGVLGPGVRPGVLSEPVESVDVTPTVLWLMGLPTAEDLDGAPVTSALVDPKPVRTLPTYENGHQPWRQQASTETDPVAREEWLKSMGYIE